MQHPISLRDPIPSHSFGLTGQALVNDPALVPLVDQGPVGEVGLGQAQAEELVAAGGDLAPGDARANEGVDEGPERWDQVLFGPRGLDLTDSRPFYNCFTTIRLVMVVLISEYLHANT